MRYLLVSIALVFTTSSFDALAQGELSFDAGLAAKDRGHFATAIRSWLPLAEAGSAEAQNNIGHMFEEGLGVSQNYQTAMSWYRKAAEQDLAQAQHNVGLLYYNGYGVQANPREAVRWFRQSASGIAVAAHAQNRQGAAGHAAGGPARSVLNARL